MADLIRKTAEVAADWWADRLQYGDVAAFRASLVEAVDASLRADDIVFLEVDYDPAGALIDAVRAAVDCSGFIFPARGILPEKHETVIEPGLIKPKEGYGNWTADIIVEDTADLTPEQREAALEAIRRLWVRRAYTTDQDFMNYAIDALLSHGFRAPGPPTEGEVERAARVKAGPGSRWEALPSVVRGLFLAQAREELTAALGRRE